MTYTQSSGQSLVDIRSLGELLQLLNPLGSESLLMPLSLVPLLLLPPTESPIICLPEVDDVDVGLVDGLHCTLTRVDTKGRGSVDTCDRYPGNIMFTIKLMKYRSQLHVPIESLSLNLF